jgi:2-polyprenyl-3-methyl-5-hydroxy-6-metoxy-1,4-benzoquinol methylase
VPERATIQQSDEEVPGGCPVCGNGSMESGFIARGTGPDDTRFSVTRCRDCGYGKNLPVVPDEEIGRWYPPVYYGKGNVRFNPLFERLVRVFRRRRASVVAGRARPGPVLDVGCGRGLMLSYLRELGFEPHGVELTEAGAWHARNKLQIDMHVGKFVEAPFWAEQFEAIVFWHSLEHMRDPAAILQHATRLLKPCGLLVVAVPNSDSLQARLFGANWFHLDVPRHYVHFGDKSLRMLLSRLGLRVTQEDHFSFEQNPYGWLQSLYNALGFDWNFLYDLIKDRGARSVSIRKHPFQALLTVALLPLFLPLSLALTVAEAALRRGGTIELYAIKEGAIQGGAQPGGSSR